MKNGFTLVELSIVLVILGLLVGGVLAGQSLIRASELRAVTSEKNSYQTAINAFKEKYLALPGDMSNATAFWSTTNNGDGDGAIEAGVASTSAEPFEFWNHLALAGLIEGTYTGITGPVALFHAIPGENVPKSKLSGGAWFAYSSGTYGGDTVLYAANYGNCLQYGGDHQPDNPRGALLKPEEGWNIDTKIDDGKPGLGRMIAIYWDNACGTGGADETDTANSVYNLSENSPQCAFYFARLF